MVTPLFYKLEDVSRKTGHSTDELLALGYQGDLHICVSLFQLEATVTTYDPDGIDILSIGDNGKGVSGCFRNKHTEVVFNMENGKALARGLFEVSQGIIHSLITGVVSVNELAVIPYEAKKIFRCVLSPEYFGDNPLSKLVIPSAELGKLMSGNEGQQSGDVGSENAKPELIEEQKKPKRKRKIKHIILYEDAIDLVKSGRIELYGERKKFFDVWAEKTDEKGKQLYHPRTINRYIEYAEEDLGKQ